MMQMSFAGLVPQFLCVTDTDQSPDDPEGNPLTELTNNSLNVCQVNGSTCSRYQFLGAAHSIVSEWSLVCDKKWVKSTVTSIQMSGVLVGAATSGQFGDYFGRKKTTYGFFLAHIFLNFIAAFSVNWQMFTFARFLIGITIGSILVMTVPYCSEYLPPRWRSLVPVMPVWSVGTSLFALAAYCLQDWAHLHYALIVFCVPWLLGYFYFPESVRWLAVHGRIKEAYKVIEQMARTNGKPVPLYVMSTLQDIANTEREAKKSGKTYSYIDVFRGRQMAKISLIFCFQWMTMSMVFYGLSFGVSSFAGNLYLNIFIIGSVDIPTNLSVLYWNNRFGRRKTTSAFLLIACLSSFGCLVARLTDPESLKSVMSGLSLTAKLGVASGWVSTIVWVGEIYPTVIRSLGYGVVNTAARIGGILAPFAINLDDHPVVSYAVMGCLIFVSVALLPLIPETNNTALQDSVKQASDHVIIVTETPTSGDDPIQTSTCEDHDTFSGSQMKKFENSEEIIRNGVNDVETDFPRIHSETTNHNDIHTGNSSRANEIKGYSNVSSESQVLTFSEETEISVNAEERLSTRNDENSRMARCEEHTLISGSQETRVALVDKELNNKTVISTELAETSHEANCCSNLDGLSEQQVMGEVTGIPEYGECGNHGFVVNTRL